MIRQEVSLNCSQKNRHDRKDVEEPVVLEVEVFKQGSNRDILRVLLNFEITRKSKKNQLDK